MLGLYLAVSLFGVWGFIALALLAPSDSKREYKPQPYEPVGYDKWMRAQPIWKQIAVSLGLMSALFALACGLIALSGH
jgi:hypothetical protein